jgi:cell division protein FtsI/penicillin-binding protein 2
MAALNEGLVDEDTKVWFDGQWFMTMTEGMAISNNVYFAHLGQVMGFETVRRYANLFGLGEKAGWNIDGEQPGVFPDAEDEMGVGRMTTFGDGISVTPLQLAAYVSALANGGTLYYLQSPRTEKEIDNFRPKVKRQLPIAKWIPSLEKGMAEAVRRGTGRRAKLRDQSIWGKTGTCSQYERPVRTRLGWFSSFNDIDGRRLAVVVMLRGGSSHGPQAAEISGKIYHTLAQAEYFTSTRPNRELASVDSGACCSPF